MLRAIKANTMRLTTFLLTFIFYSTVLGQKIGNGLTNIYKNVGMISYLPKPKQRSYGTGTLVYKRTSDTTLSAFLITCKHVLPKKLDSDIIYFGARCFKPMLINCFIALQLK